MEQIERLEQLVARRAGLQLREQERVALRKIAEARSLKLRLKPGQDYASLLEGGGSGAEAEWAHIFAQITNNESYFFRDAGQLALLEERILPEIIERNRATRTLRLWSAGCSTGEEPYSLSMLVDELLPRRAEWKVLILGTDLSEAALDKARSAVYGPWSFRALSPGRRDRYFQRRPAPLAVRGLSRSISSRPRDDGDWELQPILRASVTLQAGNLATDCFPSAISGIHDMDLIVCRNVFIYFGHEAVASTLEKFSRTLRPGGYLLAGHAELHNAPLAGLQPVAFPQTIIYQRPATSASTIPTRALLPTAPTSSPPSAAPPHVPAPHVPAPHVSRPPFEVAPAPQSVPLLQQAAAAADAGHYNLARELCQSAMREDLGSVAPHRLLASIAAEQGDHETAKSLFKKVIYLEPGLVWPYIEMDALYRREGDHARARTMRRAALQVLEALPPESALAEASSNAAQPAAALRLASAAVTVSQLIEHLKAIA